MSAEPLAPGAADPPPAELAARARRGTHAILATRVLVLVVTLASITILARLLEPEEFGLWAVATLALGLVTIFREMGLVAAIVQAPTLSPAEQDGFFWASVAVSLAAAALLALGAPLLARIYAAPRLPPVIWTCCLSLVLTGAGLVHLALLRRRLEYGKVALIEGGGMVCQLAVSVCAAYYLRSVWALVAGHVATAAWMALAAWLARRWRPGRPRRDLGGISFSFSFHVTGYNLLTYLGNNAGLLAGFRFPAAELGFFNRAQQFFNLTHFTLLLPITEVGFSLLCRLRGEAYRDAYVSLARRVWIVLLPYAALLPVVASDLVLALLGPGWRPAAPILEWFAFAVVGQAAAALFAQLMTSQGRGRELRACAAADLCLRGAGALAGSPFGVVGLAAGFSLATCLLSLPLMAWVAARQGPVRTREQLAAAWPGLLLAAFAAAVGGVAAAGAEELGLEPGWARLLFIGSGAALAWLSLCAAVPAARHALLGRALAGA